ncbi:hypothetical protein HNR00_002311 [Methylorubrum rhodinum]|uniref:Integrase n=1 Tax=Methylorubrum rhodinum TaxID=29428 RepID=A0A840ZKX5_9HYPH|nr:integrase [Methylorubrum rhodinum]MBB5757597.1 hypothetical protein [Methylorubrum rhodinum]
MLPVKASNSVSVPSTGMKKLGESAEKRHNGRVDLYWVADEKLVAKWFIPKTVRLFGDWPSQGIASRCAILQAEMLEWAAGREPGRNSFALGTIGWICRAFETDADSPIHERRRDTRVFAGNYIRHLVEAAGDERMADIIGRDVRRWHRTWANEIGERAAYAYVRTLRRVVNCGCELRDRDAIELAAVLSKTTFPQPRARKLRPSHAMIVALRTAPHEAGRPSIALAVTLQFELGLRQKDVIGEWDRPDAQARERIGGAITDGAWVWDWGLVWNHIDGTVLRKPTSKSNGHEIAEHDLSHYPELIAELPPRGVGPLVIDERSGLPWRRSHFSRTFRGIVRACGWPDGIWNMDSRAGAVTEGFEASATPADVMRAATHTQLSTTMLYNRGSVVQSGRVAEIRAARRKAKPSP